MSSKLTDAVLDQKVLDTLLIGIGADAAPHLMASLREEITASQCIITERAQSLDWHMIEVKSHALKSAAASFGAMRLSAVCRGIEENARSAHDGALLNRQCDDLANVIDATRQAFGWV